MLNTRNFGLLVARVSTDNETKNQNDSYFRIEHIYLL